MKTTDRPRGITSAAIASEQRVFLAILRVAEVFTRGLREALKPFRLTLSQYHVLQALRHTMPEGLGCRQVGERLMSRDPDITRLLDRLEMRGLIHRQRERPDRRIVHARITAQGLDLLRKLDRIVGEVQKKYLGHLGAKKLAALSSLLEATGIISWS